MHEPISGTLSHLFSYAPLMVLYYQGGIFVSDYVVPNCIGISIYAWLLARILTQSQFKRNKIQSSQAIDILTVCLQTGVASCQDATSSCAG